MNKSYVIIRNNFIGLCLLAVANAGFAKGGEENPTIVTGVVDAYIKDTVDVFVTNDAINPVPVTSVSYPREPWAVTQDILILDGSQFTNGNLGTVPAGKILVIENYTLRAVANKSRLREAWIKIKTNGITILRENMVKDSIPVSEGNANIYYDDRQARFYCDEMTDIIFSPVRDGDLTENISVRVSMSGYLVPVNSPSLAP